MAKVDAVILDAAADRGFVDPITALPPRGETGLSSLLSIYHQQGRIDWSLVKLYKANYMPTEELASDLFSNGGTLCAEYPLFFDPNNKADTDSRGGMRPDFMYMSADQRVVALIENKIGADDTHKSDEYGGQMGRYIQYLVESSVVCPYVILLTSQFFLSKSPPWYATEFQESVNLHGSEGKVKCRIIVWEEILRAFSPPLSSPNSSL